MNKKLLKSKKIWILSVVILSAGIITTFQNCSNSGGTSSSNSATAAGACTLPTTLSWIVGSYTCSATTTGTLATGGTVVLSESTPYTGSATFTCTNSILSAATSATCTPAGVVSGVCGSSNGGSSTTAPSGTAACASGTESTVSGTGPWTWTCVGYDGGTTASCSASYGSPSSLVKPCTINGDGYPAGAGFLLGTTLQSPYGNVCCEIGIGANPGNGITWTCQDSPNYTAASTSGPASPLPAGSACSLSATGYPVGGGIITYTTASTELCCSTSTGYNGATNDGVSSYCEKSSATTAVTTVAAAGTQAGTPCNVQGQDYSNDVGVTFYTSGQQRVCCEIGAGYNGAGNGKGWYCEAY